MKRILAIAAVVAGVVGLVVWWRCRDTSTEETPVEIAPAKVVSKRRVDPATVSRGAIAGIVTDDKKHAIAGAHVCALGASLELAHELLRDPICVVADGNGAYAIERLLPAAYTVSAMARSFEPMAQPRPLRAGERVIGLDFALRPGGAEVIGSVSDVTGGTVAHAAIVAHCRGEHGALVATESDAGGRFSLWVAAGEVGVSAYADGYTDGTAQVEAPGTVEIRLTPEATLAGTVVEAGTHLPIEGARVVIGRDAGPLWGYEPRVEREVEATYSDERGEFRFRRLIPGRFGIRVYADHGYGRSAGSVLVALGQHVAGVTIEVSPARRVEGKVVVAGGAKCEAPSVELVDDDAHLRVGLVGDGDGMSADGVLPGTYVPHVACRGKLARATYDPVVVANDVLGLVWEVDAGATIRGRVLTKAGAPVPDTMVRLTQPDETGFDSYARGTATSHADGSYAIEGVAVGDYRLVAGSLFATGAGDELSVTSAATIEHDLVVEATGTLRVSVVDEDRKPVPDQTVAARGTAGGFGFGVTDRSGTVVLHVSPGQYHVAVRGFSGVEVERDDEPDLVTVLPGAEATVELHGKARRGTIRGTVVEHGAPVSDAYVVALLESGGAGERASDERRQRFGVITGTDGSFTLTNLPDGPHTVTASRIGGGVAVVEHVATGSTVRVEIRATATIVGAVRLSNGKPAGDFAITIGNETDQISRREPFYRSGGRYKLSDLPAGKYTLSCEASGANQRFAVEVAEGETKTLDFEVAALVSVTGRILDLRTREPVPDIHVSASRTDNGGEGLRDTTNATGVFKLQKVPAGTLVIYAYGSGNGYRDATITRTVEVTVNAFDVGDIPMLRARAWGDTIPGDPGFEVDADLRVKSIVPDGPAASSGLLVGDVVTGVDGIDVAAPNHHQFDPAIAAPPGTKVVLRLSRGATVTITLGTR